MKVQDDESDAVFPLSTLDHSHMQTCPRFLFRTLCYVCSGFEFHFPRLAFPDSTVQYLELGIWSLLSWSRQQLSILFCGQDLWALSWSTVSLAPSGSILSSGFVASLSWSRASNSGLCFELRIWAQSWSKASTSGLCFELRIWAQSLSKASKSGLYFELRIWAQSWSKASKSGLYFELRIWAQSWSKASNSGLCFVLRIWAHSWSKASTSGLYSQLGILASLSWSLAIATPDSILCSGFELRPGLYILSSVFVAFQFTGELYAADSCRPEPWTIWKGLKSDDYTKRDWAIRFSVSISY